MKKQAFWQALLLLLTFGMFAQPALAVDPANGNPTRADVIAEMKKVDKVRAGLGDDEGKPVVTPFALPAGVRIAGKAVGADENGKCPDDSGFSGVYRDVQICLPVCNIGRNVANVIFPPGLVITTASEGFQNGLLVQRTVVAVPPITCTASAPPADKKDDGGPPVEKGVFWVKLSAYCLNESQNPASSEGRYTLSGVTADADLLDLASFLSKRNITSEKGSKVAQQAIYSITEKKGLTWQDRKDLYALPML